MKTVRLLFFLLVGLQSFGQGYLFKSEDVQITFSRKPIVDTTMTVEGYRTRFVMAKDSLSNYYLSLSEKLVKDSQDPKNNENLSSFRDGVMDSMNERYKATIISKRELEVNGQKVGEYYSKGYYGQTPIFIKAWVCLKGDKTIVCQHLYSVAHEARLQTKQQVFFDSLVL